MIKINSCSALDTNSVLTIAIGNNLNKLDNVSQKITQALSSGSKINQAADNPAGIYLATELNSQARLNMQCCENIQVASNMLSVADGALEGISSALNRVQELTLQVANGFYSDEQRNMMQAEANQLYEQIDQTIAGAKFNGQALFQDVNSNPEKVSLILSSDAANEASIVYNTELMVPEKVDLSSTEAALKSLDMVKTQQDNILNKRAEIGAQLNRLDSAYEANNISMEASLGTYSSIADTDYAAAIMELNQINISQKMLLQVMKVEMDNSQNILNLLSSG